jgi:hypothetical protein
MPQITSTTPKKEDAMKLLRQIGSLIFVLGLFIAIFAGIPWYVFVADDPVMPWWMRTSACKQMKPSLL